MPYSENTQALSATTAQVIHGSKPYLTFDNGVTKVTTTKSLLDITLSDGTHITPETNTSTARNPIVLPVENQSFTDIGMSVPTTADSITLNELIGAPNNYWGDDDGDGQGANGIKITGNLRVKITNIWNLQVSRNVTLDICEAPYKVELTSTSGDLTTQYGVPNTSSIFSGGTAIYYIGPKAKPKICYLKPDINSDEYSTAGPVNIWKFPYGFLEQSTESSTYNRNFPTTGANNLYFDILVGGIDAATLTWPTTVTQGGITATITLNPPVKRGLSSVRVNFTGPVATTAQHESSSQGRVATPTLPQTFELVGYDSSHTAILKYGFVLKQWFVYRGNEIYTYPDTLSWCSNLGGGYRMPQPKDLTNAKCGVESHFPCVNGIDGATPSSNAQNYQRNIGAGFITEWGNLKNYPASGFPNTPYFRIWVSGSRGPEQFYVSTSSGDVSSNVPSELYHGLCTYP